MKKVVSFVLAMVLLVSVLVIPAGATTFSVISGSKSTAVYCDNNGSYYTYTVQVSDGINVRKSTTTSRSDNIVGCVAAGSKIRFIEVAYQNGYWWAKIESGSTFTSGSTGSKVGYWIALIDNTIPASTRTYTIKSSDGANVRKDAGTGKAVMGALSKGSVVYYDKTAKANGYIWYHIVKVNAKSGSRGSTVGYWVANV